MSVAIIGITVVILLWHREEGGPSLVYADWSDQAEEEARLLTKWEGTDFIMPRVRDECDRTRTGHPLEYRYWISARNLLSFSTLN